MRNLQELFGNSKLIGAYLAFTLAFVVYFIFDRWETIPVILSSSRLDYLFIGLMLGFLNVAGFGFVCYSLYKELGADVSYWKTLQMVLASRTGVYLPGKIWYALNFYIFSRRLNLSPSVIFQGFGLTNLFLFITGGICSLPILFHFFSSQQEIYLVIILFLIITFSHPKSIKYLCSVFPKLQQTALDRLSYSRFSSGQYLKFILQFFVLWIIAGLRLYFIVMTLTQVDPSHFPPVLAASSASLLLGLLAFFAPAGIGVREGVGVAVLSTIIPVETAFLVMIISRVLSATTDLGGGLVSFYLFRKTRKETQKPQTTVHLDGPGVTTR